MHARGFEHKAHCGNSQVESLPTLIVANEFLHQLWVTRVFRIEGGGGGGGYINILNNRLN